MKHLGRKKSNELDISKGQVASIRGTCVDVLVHRWVFFPDDESGYISYSQIAVYTPKIKMFYDEEGEDIEMLDDVTHWMLLTAPAEYQTKNE